MQRRFVIRQHKVNHDENKKEKFLRERAHAFANAVPGAFRRDEQRQHAVEYIVGLASRISPKNVEAIAYLNGHDRRALQSFIGCSPWDWCPVTERLTGEVRDSIATSDGVLVVQPTKFKKSGNESVGVVPQLWDQKGGRNCQLGIYLGYDSPAGQGIVDARLWLPEDWAEDPIRRRRAGVPEQLAFQTPEQIGSELLRVHADLPHAWVTGDDCLAESGWLRRQLAVRGERYVLGTTSALCVREPDLNAPLMKNPAVGRHPYRAARAFVSAASSSWERVTVPGPYGEPRTFDAVKHQVVAKTGKNVPGGHEVLIVLRQPGETFCPAQQQYYLSNAPYDTPLAEFAYVALAPSRVDGAIQFARYEAGLEDYEVRTWRGWHHHQALALVAAWLLGEYKRSRNVFKAGPQRPAVAKELYTQHRA